MQQIYTLVHRTDEQRAGMHSSESRHACHAPVGLTVVVAGTAVTVSPLLRRLFGARSGVYRNTCDSPGRSIRLFAVYLGIWQPHALQAEKATLDTHPRLSPPRFEPVDLHRRGFQAHSLVEKYVTIYDQSAINLYSNFGQ